MTRNIYTFAELFLRSELGYGLKMLHFCLCL